MRVASPQPREPRRALGWLLLSALVVKLVYLTQYLSLPFLYGPLFDSQVYLLQAERVRQGQLGDASLLAFSPLYGYVLAALGATAASLAPVLMQLALGLVNMLLVHRLTERSLGVGAAPWAAGLYAAYGPLLCLETKIMSETLGLSLLLLSIERLTQPAAVRGTLVQAGVSLGLALLARASLLLVAPLLVLAAWLAPSDASRPGELAPLRRPSLFAGGLLLVLTAHGLWTHAHSGLFVPVILASNTSAQGSQRAFAGDLSIYRQHGEAGVSAFSVVRQAEARLARRRADLPEPRGTPFSLAGVLAQAPRKVWLTLRDEETSFDYGFYGERTEAWALRLTGASFGMILVLAGLGAARRLEARARLALLPLVAVALGTLLTTILFHPSTRYRLPLLVSMLPLAGLACSTAFGREAVTEAVRLRYRLLCLAILIGFGARGALHSLAHPALWELRVAESSALEGDSSSAHSRLARARALAPGDASVRARIVYVEQVLASRLRVR